MRTIRQQLLGWLLGGTLVCSLPAGYALYYKVRQEASELADEQLRLVAESLPIGSNSNHCVEEKYENEPEEKVVFQAWDTKGNLIYSCSSDGQVPRFAVTGFSSVTVGKELWRVFSMQRQSVFVQAAQPMDVRSALAAKIAMRSLFPFLFFFPGFALFIWVVVGRSLLPLNRLADAVSHRNADALTPLSVNQLPPEIKQVVEALNDLLHRLELTISAQRAFVADASHELRTPLTALKLQLQLAETAVDENQRNAAFEKLHDRLDRASRLVQQLLVLARQDTVIASNNINKVDLHELALQSVSDFYMFAERKHIDLGLDAESAQCFVQGNAGNLQILLNNLIDNALRYSPENSKVDVSTQIQDDVVVLRVSDRGPGIPAADYERVFDRFYRGDAGKAWGSGLGLAIVKKIADSHNATVTLSLTDVAGGLCVTLMFTRSLDAPITK